jgi:hypothetical protein
MSFLATGFLVALVAAAGPLIIHLLNRRRHRTVQWAAMEFLREAIRRNKRIVEFRDVLLLLLRTAAVILFVLAMARPYWKSDKTDFRGQPIHAVLLVDNSLSMGYMQLDQTLLDKAREKAAEYVRSLPAGSDVSIVPLASGSEWHVENVYATKQDALNALDTINLADRPSSASRGAELAQTAKGASSIQTKRFVYFTDMQESTWEQPNFKQFDDPGEVQVVQLSPADRANTWISEFRLQDEIADAETTATFLATISHRGPERSQVRVSLIIDGAVADEDFVDLKPDQNLELEFQHKFTESGPPHQPLLKVARVEIQEKDRLAQDDFRTCIAPVVSRLPIVFVDNLGPPNESLGQGENPAKNRFGETYLLRKLLRRRTASDDKGKQLASVVHRTQEMITREDLKDARLVVVAGVSAPSPDFVQILREYVQQEGQLLLAAGGEFDPVAWNEAAWLDGAGILPAKLKPEPIGRIPLATATEAPKFRLASNTFRNDEVFNMGLNEGDMEFLLNLPVFFKAVGIDTSAETQAQFEKAEEKRLSESQQLVSQHLANRDKWIAKENADGLSAEEKSKRDESVNAFEMLSPTWLNWSSKLTGASQMDGDIKSHEVIGRYDLNDEIFAVRRQIGEGQVVMITTGCFPVWNNIAARKSALIFDQVLQNLLSKSLPNYNFSAEKDIPVRIAARDQAAEFELTSPDDEKVDRSAEALGARDFGIVLRSLGQRGVHSIRRKRGEERGSDQQPWSIKLAVNGPSNESELTNIDESAFEDAPGMTEVRWVGADETISLDGTSYSGRNAWKWLLFGVLICLLVEMLLLLPKVMATLTGNAAPSGAASGAATGGNAP